MKKVLIIALSLFAISCESKNSGMNSAYAAPAAPQQTIVASGSIGENLDLQALGELVRKSQNAEDIENRLNANNSINNLDLDEDGNVDYIRVTEYGSGHIRGFSFVAVLDGDNQEVATIEVKNINGYANVNIYGNEGLYGAGCTFTYNYPIAQLFLFHYLFRPHTIYVSPYRFGYYPRTYRVYRTVPIHTYRTTVVTRHRGSYTYTRNSYSRPHYTSPNRSYHTSKYSTKHNNYHNRGNNNNYNKHNNYNNNRNNNNYNKHNNYTAPRNNYSSPNKSQKSFTPTTNNRPNTGGFKSNSTYRPTTTNHSSGSSYSGSSNRSSNRSSGSSYSSGSSNRSSGSSSRSGGFGSSSRSSGSSSRSSGSSSHSSSHHSRH